MPDQTFTAAQIAIAARELLDSAGSDATPTSQPAADPGPYSAALPTSRSRTCSSGLTSK
jgi:hypothetical protein